MYYTAKTKTCQPKGSLEWQLTICCLATPQLFHYPANTLFTYLVNGLDSKDSCKDPEADNAHKGQGNDGRNDPEHNVKAALALFKAAIEVSCIKHHNSLEVAAANTVPH
jgi:hypothetical protein